jgi:prepilin-type N-terminal cleavage/methylation domain-containing protein
MKTKQGFTLIELLIGIALSGMIFIAVSSVIFILFSSNTRVKQLDTMAQTKNDLQLELSNSIRWAKDISITDAGHTINLITSDDKNIVYRWDTDTLYKDDVALTPKEITVKGFTAADYSASTNLKSLEITIDLEDAKFKAVKDTMRLVVSQRIAGTAH